MRYFRRFRMEFSFAERDVDEPVLPEGYEFLPWNPLDLERHSQAKFSSFDGEVDAQVFPCLSTLDGCRRLMLEISSQRSFLPAATWLIHRNRQRGTETSIDCGIIQGLANSREAGSVQNVGVIRTERGIGLGRALLLKSLHGFREYGLRRVYLEATAENIRAVELYRSIGFRLIRTTYKQADSAVDS
jgi:ribosomal protein S18 acetylase RimI-like enzyme